MLTSNKKDIVNILILAFLYFTTAELSSYIFSNTSIISIGIFIPEGIALAFALYFGKKVVPGIFIGQFLFAFLNTDMPLFSLIVAINNSLEALLGIYLFSKFKLDTKLTTFRDMIGLVLLSALILEPFSAISSNIFLYMQGDLSSEKFLITTFSWWFGNFMSQVLYTPFLLILFHNYKTINLKEYIFYGFFYGSVIFILLFVFLIENHFLVLTLTLPMLIFIIFQRGILYGTMLTVILSLLTAFSFVWNIGVFQIGTSFNNTVNYNLFVLLHVFISLIVGLLVEQRKKYEEELHIIIEKEVQKNKDQQLLMVQQSRLAQMGEMISMIAHQWRQPLNNLSLINQLLVSKYNKGELDEKMLEYFKTNSKNQIDLMSSTIDDFRNFFKSEKIKKEVELKAVLENLFEITQSIYVTHGIDVKLNIEECLEVYVFPNTFAQALLNIINNAKDVLLEREIKKKEIYISAKKENDDVVVTLEDNAGGIDPQILERIFDPYFSTKKEKNGTGLGLYMTKMIIEEQLEAKISVQNSQNGAKFTIRLKGKNCEH